MKEKFLYLLSIILIRIIGILPNSIQRLFFQFCTTIIHIFAFKTNKIIKTNLKFVLTEKALSKQEIKEIIRYSYHNILLWLRTLINSRKITNTELKNNITVEDQHYMNQLLNDNKKIIVISGHFGNMEMLSIYFNRFITPLVQVARNSNFKTIDNFITKTRESHGGRIVYKSGALKHLTKALKMNETLSLVIDQSTNMKDGIKVNFLGKVVSQTKTTANLARRFDAHIIPVAIFNQSDDKYKIKFYPPITPTHTDDRENDVLISTQLQADAISRIISEDKKQWFWAHKRFKLLNPEIYKSRDK